MADMATLNGLLYQLNRDPYDNDQRKIIADCLGELAHSLNNRKFQIQENFVRDSILLDSMARDDSPARTEVINRLRGYLPELFDPERILEHEPRHAVIDDSGRLIVSVTGADVRLGNVPEIAKNSLLWGSSLDIMIHPSRGIRFTINFDELIECIRMFGNPGAESLNISGHEHISDIALAITRAREIGNYPRLILENNNLGNTGAGVISGCPYLVQTEFLSLRENSIGRIGVLALATSPYLHALTHLDLSSVIYEGNDDRGTGNVIPGDALRTLAWLLPNLTSFNFHGSIPGAQNVPNHAGAWISIIDPVDPPEKWQGNNRGGLVNNRKPSWVVSLSAETEKNRRSGRDPTP